MLTSAATSAVLLGEIPIHTTMIPCTKYHYSYFLLTPSLHFVLPSRMSAAFLLRNLSTRSSRAASSSVAFASSSNTKDVVVGAAATFTTTSSSVTHAAVTTTTTTLPRSSTTVPATCRLFSSSSSTSTTSHDSAAAAAGGGKSDKLTYPIVPRGDFGEYQEYSVIFTNRALNLMSKPFQQVMRDLNDLLKVTYNAHKVAIMPG
jgi:hypothetical protein